jgi:hypothetical protein
MEYPKFNLSDLASISLAIEHEREREYDRHSQQLEHLDRLSAIVRRYVDAYKEEKHEELVERGFYPHEPMEVDDDEEVSLY